MQQKPPFRVDMPQPYSRKGLRGWMTNVSMRFLDFSLPFSLYREIGLTWLTSTPLTPTGSKAEACQPLRVIPTAMARPGRRRKKNGKSPRQSVPGTHTQHWPDCPAKPRREAKTGVSGHIAGNARTKTRVRCSSRSPKPGSARGSAHHTRPAWRRAAPRSSRCPTRTGRASHRDTG